MEPCSTRLWLATRTHHRQLSIFAARCARSCIRCLIGVHYINVDRFGSVMPAHAGVQEDSVFILSSIPWIPGLALLARNDVAIACPLSSRWWSRRLFGVLHCRSCTEQI